MSTSTQLHPGSVQLLITPIGRYEGECQGGYPHGRGVYAYINGHRYEGEFARGQPNGEGAYFYASGNRYQGGLLNGKKHGAGTFSYTSGDLYQGEYVEDKMDGAGKYSHANGEFYEGQYVQNERHGKGVYFYANGDRYEGDYFRDHKQGIGTYFFANGHRHRYKGEFVADTMQGRGEWINRVGNRLGTVRDAQGIAIEFFEQLDGGRSELSIYAGETDPSQECALVVESSYSGERVCFSDQDRKRWIEQIEISGCATQFIRPVDFRSLIGSIPEEKSIKILAIRAHGCFEGMKFGETEDLIGLFELQPLLTRLSQKPLIILQSCFTGGAPETVLSRSRVVHRLSLAEQIALQRPDATIIAPEGEVHPSFTTINCKRNSETKRFAIGVQMFHDETFRKIDRIFKGRQS